MTTDIIRVSELLATVRITSGARWEPKSSSPTLQPVSISISIPHDVRFSSSKDDLSSSINYSTISKTIRDSVDAASTPAAFDSLEHILQHLFHELMASGVVQQVTIQVVQLKPPLHSRSVSVEATSVHGIVTRAIHSCHDLECDTILGVNPAERLEKQLVRISLSVEKAGNNLNRSNWIDFRSLLRRLYEGIRLSSYLTLEAFASFTALETLKELSQQHQAASPPPQVTIKASKPWALVFAQAAEVEICRSYCDYPEVFPLGPKISADLISRISFSKAIIALGSNLGDRFQNIEAALRLLEDPQRTLRPMDMEFSVAITDTSFMYETEPMYVGDQPAFINCACTIETNIPPQTLLILLKKIEVEVGRVPSFRNGPRAIDLDIILYDDLVVDSRAAGTYLTQDVPEGSIVVPHPRMAEREFVMRPVCDMIPGAIHPVLMTSMAHILGRLISSNAGLTMQKVLPFPQPLAAADGRSDAPPTLTYWSFSAHSAVPVGSNAQRTRVMATLNATPDSFSDGGVHDSITSALSYATLSAEAEASIIDIGGYSTRPAAAFVTEDDEISRIVPIITSIRASSKTERLPISIDTFRPSVAAAAIQAGANCINDVYAFSGPNAYPPHPDARADEDRYHCGMKALSRQYAVPAILMHSRGDSGQNKDYSEYNYAARPVIEGVQVELGDKVNRIVKGKGGLRRWLVIVDPGVGFSKTLDGNLEILRHRELLTSSIDIGDVSSRRPNPLNGYPLLIGTSRKSFLAAVLSQRAGRDPPPKDRAWATAAAVACAVAHKADIIRVHDVAEMTDVIRVTEALYP